MSEIDRCLKTGGYFLFSRVVPPDESMSEEYDWLVGRDIHYPIQTEILDWITEFHIKDIHHYILASQSIMNWLNNTCNDEREKEKIIERHLKTSKRYKYLVNFSTPKNDILVDIKHLMIVAVK